MKVTIDRFEGNFAICEKSDRTMISISKDKIPLGAKEGDILSIEGDNIKIDTGGTAKRKKVVDDLMNDLWK
jgi:hypothetical protein